MRICAFAKSEYLPQQKECWEILFRLYLGGGRGDGSHYAHRSEVPKMQNMTSFISVNWNIFDENLWTPYHIQETSKNYQLIHT